MVDKTFFTKFKKIMIAWFALGLIWAWGLIAVSNVIIDYNQSYIQSITQKEMPEIINTVETIPVEVYKLDNIFEQDVLEREDK